MRIPRSVNLPISKENPGDFLIRSRGRSEVISKYGWVILTTIEKSRKLNAGKGEKVGLSLMDENIYF